uniref:Uncharacterized protein n=1 Tax=Anopheles albimanus TaxID=7167 RepID=A0A182FFI2_ANOAL
YGRDITHHFTAYLPKLDPDASSYQQQQQQQQFVSIPPVGSAPQTTSPSSSSTSSSSPSSSSAAASTGSAVAESPSPTGSDPQRSPSHGGPVHGGTVKKSLAMCFTSTGTALSLPPKKKDIYRPYSLDDRPPRPNYELRIPAEEDLHAAHAILDLSASTAFLPPPAPHQLALAASQPPPSPQPQPPNPTVILVPAKSPADLDIRRPSSPMLLVPHHQQQQPQQHHQVSASLPMLSPQTIPSSLGSPEQNENRNSTNTLPTLDSSRSSSSNDLQQIGGGSSSGGGGESASDSEGPNGSKTVAYTYEAFFVSDGRSKKKMADPKTALEAKAKYTCTECGKHSIDSSSMDGELRMSDRRHQMALKRESNVDIEGDDSSEAPMSPVPHLTVGSEQNR